MFGLFKKKENPNYEDKINEAKKRQQASIDKRKNEMLSSPCAIRSDFMKCTDACIHFQDGWPIVFEDFGKVWEGSRMPRCKLWTDD